MSNSEREFCLGLESQTKASIKYLLKLKCLETDGKSCLDFQLSSHLANPCAEINGRLACHRLDLTKVLSRELLPDKLVFKFKQFPFPFFQLKNQSKYNL